MLSTSARRVYKSRKLSAASTRELTGALIAVHIGKVHRIDSCGCDSLLRTSTMPNELQGKRVAALVEQGFEQIELLEPRGALEAAGATVDVVSSQLGNVRGWNHMNWGDDVHVDRALSTAIPDA